MSTTPSSNANSESPVTVTRLRGMKADGEKIVMLTAYDASFAVQLNDAGVHVVLVGDSLGMVIQGQQTTVPVTIEDVLYHTACVAGSSGRMLVVADMPFMSFRDVDTALENASRLMQEGGAHMVKLEGGQHVLPVVEALAQHGIPVCGHIGLQPQSIHKLGGYRVQGREPEMADALLAEAQAMEKAGADIILMECVPASLAARITAALAVPTIGIGAGPDCDGQVLVLYDLLGITPGHRPRFARDFLTNDPTASDIPAALRAYVKAVTEGSFPGSEHSFS